MVATDKKFQEVKAKNKFFLYRFKYTEAMVIPLSIKKYTEAILRQLHLLHISYFSELPSDSNLWLRVHPPCINQDLANNLNKMLIRKHKLVHTFFRLEYFTKFTK